MDGRRKEWSEDRLDEYHRGWKKGPREAWHPPPDVIADDERVRKHVNALLGVSLPLDVLEIHDGALPWPRSWTWRVHRRILQYHPSYSHTEDARQYYDYSDEELYCSLCVKLDIDFEAAREMDAWTLLRVVYARIRELRVPEQAGGSRFM